MKLFDSHAHLTEESFAAELRDVLSRAAEAGVEGVVSIASDPEDAAAAVQLAGASSQPRVYASAGLHPHAAHRWSPELPIELERLAAADEVVAIGETGLDFHYDNAPRDRQISAFRAQMELAERIGLPVVVHARDADNVTAALIREYTGRVIGVLHCFSGGEELLRAGLDADWYVSFSGIVTFKSYDGAAHVRAVPDSRLLIETDSPYLAPVPMRGRRNEPAFVRHVAARVAELRSTEIGTVADLTYQNARRLYGIEE